MPTPTIPDGELFFNATLWTGNGSTQTITNGAAGQSFQPDFLWVKERSEARSNLVWDSVRGSNLGLITNTTSSESAQPSFTGFVSNGFGVSNADSSDITNKNAQTYVAWQWKAGGAAVTNNVGSLSSQVSANTTSGFSVVTYSANGSTGTVGHGLGAAPKMIIVKKRNVAERWCVFHTSTSNAYIYLNETNGADTANAQFRFGNNSSVVQPSSTVFTIGSSNDVNGTSGTYVAYCWSQIDGYSAFGGYTGNGSNDGVFIYTGFRPRWFLVKRTDSAGSWVLTDTSRSPINVTDQQLYPNLSNAESSDPPQGTWDMLSNGVKMRYNASNYNASGGTYIYMAFAENPFKYSLAR